MVMRLLLTGRHVKVTPALRRYVEVRLFRLARYGTELGDVQVIIEVEKYRHVAEAKLTLNGRVIQARASTKEMYASIDLLLDRVSRQVAKRKERLINHKPRPFGRRAAIPKPRAAAPRLVTRTVPVPLLTTDEAMDRLQQTKGEQIIFLNAALDRVQIMRRLSEDEIEVIDPRPVSPRGS
jgi:putative sigma-54 modulation protein